MVVFSSMLHKELPEGIKHATHLTVVVICCGNPNFDTDSDGHIILVVYTILVLGYLCFNKRKIPCVFCCQDNGNASNDSFFFGGVKL